MLLFWSICRGSAAAMEIPERNKSKLRGPKTYEEEPRRDPSLQINSKEPFNAEPSPFALSRSYITPEDKFYKRNHGPIPVLMEPSTYHLVLTGLVEKPLSLSLEYLRQLPKHVVTATLQVVWGHSVAPPTSS